MTQDEDEDEVKNDLRLPIVCLSVMIVFALFSFCFVMAPTVRVLVAKFIK